MNWDMYHAGSGRTHRMLCEAMEKQERGENVLLLFVDKRQMEEAMSRLQDMGMVKVNPKAVAKGPSTTRIKLTCLSQPDLSVPPENMLISSALRAKRIAIEDDTRPYAVLLDHYVIETIFRKELDLLHRYDNPAAFAPNVAMTGGAITYSSGFAVGDVAGCPMKVLTGHLKNKAAVHCRIDTIDTEDRAKITILEGGYKKQKRTVTLDCLTKLDQQHEQVIRTKNSQIYQKK